MFLVMCQLSAPSDKPGSRMSCNLCHNYQSDTNRYSICLSTGNPTDPYMTNPAKLHPICSKENHFHKDLLLSSDGISMQGYCKPHDATFTDNIDFPISVWAQHSHPGVGQ